MIDTERRTQFNGQYCCVVTVLVVGVLFVVVAVVFIEWAKKYRLINGYSVCL